MLRQYRTAILLVALAIALAACGGSGSGGRGTRAEEREVNVAVDAFLAGFTTRDTSVFTHTVEVNTKDGSIIQVPAEDVWDHLMTEYFNGVSASAVVLFNSANGDFVPSLQDRKIAIAKNDASVVGTLIGGDAVYPVRMTLTKQSGSWRIHRLFVMLLAGNWSGTWVSEQYDHLGGTVEAQFVQNGLILGGEVRAQDGVCFTRGALTGSVSGDRTLFGIIEGEVEVQFESTYLNPDRIEGKYTIRNICWDQGSFILTRDGK